MLTFDDAKKCMGIKIIIITFSDQIDYSLLYIDNIQTSWVDKNYLVASHEDK